MLGTISPIEALLDPSTAACHERLHHHYVHSSSMAVTGCRD
ncbi:hypothetical protein [Vibrio hepatarius]|nr:hypothetical protein [Vibrio hepatarius]